MTELSHVKDVQERQVAETFVTNFNQVDDGSQITDLHQLPENDHDFSALVSGSPVVLQITELVDRSYTFDMTPDEYDYGTWQEAVQEEYGKQPRRVDVDLRNQALTKLITGKIAKTYAKPASSELWLVVFSTVHYETEFIEAGERRESEALRLAREHLETESCGPFDQMWFTDLWTRPIRVWPTGYENQRRDSRDIIKGAEKPIKPLRKS